MTDKRASLLATLRTALDASPPAVAERGTLRLHTLFSIPRQVKSLYPLAHIHPTDLEHNKRAAPITAYEEQIFVTASWRPHSPSTSANNSAPTSTTDGKGEREGEGKGALLALAMELYVYTIPELASAVLYISKLDSSGWGPSSIPSALRPSLSGMVLSGGKQFGGTLTSTLTSAVTQHFTTFRHWEHAGSGVEIAHVSVHILARSQRAYLFPSSPENARKKVLSDGGLIKWWRAVMSDVILGTRTATSAVRAAAAHPVGEPIDTRAFYVIPGYSELESHPLVPLIRAPALSPAEQTHEQALHAAQWTYGHPYSPAGAACAQTDLPPLPLHWRRSAFVQSASKGEANATAVEVETDPKAEGYDPRVVRTVPTLMPHFGDDPKTRFLDEMARDAHEHSGWKKKAAVATANDTAPAAVADANGASTCGQREDGAAETDQAQDGSDRNGQGAPKKRAGDYDEQQDHQPPQEKRSKPNHQEKPHSAAPQTITDPTALGSASSPTSASASTAHSATGTPLVTLRALMRERAMMDDLPIDEFWERMGFRQECCSGNAIGVLVVLFTRPPPSSSPSSHPGAATVERRALSVPYKVLGDLVFKSLMRDTCEWNKHSHALSLTQAWIHNVDREVKRKGGLAQLEPHTHTADGAAAAGAGDGNGSALVGEGVVWIDIVLAAPTPQQLEHARHIAQTTATTTPTNSTRAPTTMLSVKRKKKPS